MPERKAKKILIVEDDQSYRLLLEEQFSKTNYETYFSKNGREGLDYALAAHPDLIILDIIMPVMDGVTMLDDLRQDEYGANVKVIVLTNLDIDSGIREESTEEHHSYYRIKSDIKMHELIELIDNLLDENREIDIKKEAA